MGRPEKDHPRYLAISVLGNGLLSAKRYDDALSVQEAELSMESRLGRTAYNLLVVQSNLAVTYEKTGRLESALQMKRDVYSGRLKLNGEEHEETLRAANNYAASLIKLERFREAKRLLRRTTPVARRILGNSHDLTLVMRTNYARTLCEADGRMLDDLREAVTTLEDAERIARRVLGGAHPTTTIIEQALRKARATLRARETQSPPVSA